MSEFSQSVGPAAKVPCGDKSGAVSDTPSAGPARRGRRKTMAKPAEVARWLEVKPEEVRDYIRREEMPATAVPARTRMVYRIPLRGLHGWWLERTRNVRAEMKDFETWATDFWAAATPRR